MMYRITYVALVIALLPGWLLGLIAAALYHGAVAGRHVFDEVLDEAQEESERRK